MENGKFDLTNYSRETISISKVGIEAFAKITESECSDIDLVNKNLQERFSIQKKIAEKSKTSNGLNCVEKKMEQIINEQIYLMERKSTKRKIAKVLSVGLAVLPSAIMLISAFSQNKSGYKPTTKI